jgi:hypothetical protein
MADNKSRNRCRECYFGGHEVWVEASFSPDEAVGYKQVECPKCGAFVAVRSPYNDLHENFGRERRRVGDDKWWTQYLGLDVKDYQALDRSPEFSQRLRALESEHKDRLVQSIGTVTYYYRKFIGESSRWGRTNLKGLDDDRRRLVRVEVALGKGLITNTQGNGVLKKIHEEIERKLADPK